MSMYYYSTFSKENIEREVIGCYRQHLSLPLILWADGESYFFITVKKVGISLLVVIKVWNLMERIWYCNSLHSVEEKKKILSFRLFRFWFLCWKSGRESYGAIENRCVQHLCNMLRFQRVFISLIPFTNEWKRLPSFSCFEMTFYLLGW